MVVKIMSDVTATVVHAADGCGEQRYAARERARRGLPYNEENHQSRDEIIGLVVHQVAYHPVVPFS